MKTILIVLGMSVILISCESGSGEKGPVNKDSLANAQAEEEKVKKAEEGLEKAKSELDKLTPLDENELKAKLPSSLGGAPQENASVENNSGVNIVTADYKVNDSSSVTLSIIDCAGSAGVGIYTRQFLGMANALQETDDEYTREATIAGYKGYEYCEKEANDCVITWFAANRYLVTLEGYDADALKKLAGQLTIK